MTIWELLGIEATTELSAIRTAYAARAKEVHPEEHPEEFLQLQAAYKTAVKYAKFHRATAEKTDIAPEDAVRQQEKDMPQPSENTVLNDPVLESSSEEEQTFDFDYDEIQSQNLNDQFFKEFFAIAWNPWLMNNLACWAIFLGRPRYQKLFQKKDFRKNLVMSMCYLSGWHRNTIRFFDAFLKNFQAEEDARPETEYFLWKWRKYKLFNKGVFTVERFVTHEQKALHEVLLAGAGKKFDVHNLKNKKVSQTFSGNQKALLAYLWIYSNYASKRSNNLERLYQGNKQGRLFMKTFAFFIVLFLLFFLYIHLFGGFPN